jgi:hypothetical protein
MSLSYYINIRQIVKACGRNFRPTDGLGTGPVGGQSRRPERTGRAGAASGPQGRRPRRAGRGAPGSAPSGRAAGRTDAERRHDAPSGRTAARRRRDGGRRPPQGWGQRARRPARLCMSSRTDGDSGVHGGGGGDDSRADPDLWEPRGSHPPGRPGPIFRDTDFSQWHASRGLLVATRF